jgi:hypothetical protein
MVRAMDWLKALRVHLGQSLFLDSPATENPLGGVEKAVLVAALLSIAIVFQLLRVGFTGSLDAIWAEDGPVFLAEALVHGTWHAIGTEYSGYLVVVPRLISEVATLVPLRDAGAAISILSAAAVALSGLAVWYASSAHISNPYLRGTLAAATVLVPVGGLETIDSAAYVSWYMLFATFWLLLWRPRTHLGATLAAVFVLATALSNPGVWFFVPLVVLRAIAVRDRRDLTIVVAYFLGALIQVRAVAISNYEAVEPVWSSKIWGVLAQRLVDGTAFGLRLGGVAWSHLGWPFLIVLTICMVAGFTIGLRHSSASARWLAAIAIPTALVMFIVSIYQRAAATGMLWPEGSWNGSAGRYSVVPVLLLISVALVIVNVSLKRRSTPTTGRPWLAVAMVALLLVSVGGSFSVQDTAVRGTPTWTNSLDRAASACTTQQLETVPVPTSPPGFGMVLTCDQIAAR